MIFSRTRNTHTPCVKFDAFIIENYSQKPYSTITRDLNNLHKSPIKSHKKKVSITTYILTNVASNLRKNIQLRCRNAYNLRKHITSIIDPFYLCLSYLKVEYKIPPTAHKEKRTQLSILFNIFRKKRHHGRKKYISLLREKMLYTLRK